jgi:hypothetical protein
MLPTRQFNLVISQASNLTMPSILQQEDAKALFFCVVFLLFIHCRSPSYKANCCFCLMFLLFSPPNSGAAVLSKG